METQELRRGNYIDRNGLMKVWSISPMRIKIYDCVNKCLIDHMFFISTFNPIPLTEDWLLKFGFEKMPHYTVGNSLVKNIGRGRSLSIGCVGTPNEMLFIEFQEKEQSKKIDDIITIWNYDYDGSIHVHQLQNLYFALTGTELELK